MFNQSIQWQKHDVKDLRASSIWNQSYEKVVLLLARAICTIHSQIFQVFGNSILELENLSTNETNQKGPSTLVPEKLFMDCLSLGCPATWKDSDEYFKDQSRVIQSRTCSLFPFNHELNNRRERFGKLCFGPNSRLTMFSPTRGVSKTIDEGAQLRKKVWPAHIHFWVGMKLDFNVFE
ncbi:hypothetical protein KSP39_PZI005013 [Platanthera zijinensis]|uniref:Uncharacterized protein n=1 Tax=Platanthera zijinensis TaxID=2320716 RepID=A0AAP0GB40_9ASPA